MPKPKARAGRIEVVVDDATGSAHWAL